jgi:hypothetical protein
VKNRNGSLVYDLEKIQLIAIGNQYITRSLSFSPGSYTVEDFIVVDDEDSAVYLTTKVDYEFENLVNAPLPVPFDVTPEITTDVVLEVIPANLGEPVQFGYATFSFNVVNTLEKGLLAYFPFDDSIVEVSGNNIPFQNSSVELTTDYIGNPTSAAKFDGVGAHINLNNDEPLITSTTFSIAAWVKMDGPGGGFDVERNIVFQQRDDNATSSMAQSTILLCSENRFGQASFVLRSSETDLMKILVSRQPYNEWHHYVATLSANKEMSLYIDGCLVADTTYNFEGDFSTGIDYVDVGIQNYKGKLQGALNGDMDDFRVYNRELQPREVYELYNK